MARPEFDELQAALKVVHRARPCDHAGYKVHAISGGQMASCPTCGISFNIDNLERVREPSRRFDELLNRLIILIG